MSDFWMSLTLFRAASPMIPNYSAPYFFSKPIQIPDRYFPCRALKSPYSLCRATTCT